MFGRGRRQQQQQQQQPQPQQPEHPEQPEQPDYQDITNLHGSIKPSRFSCSNVWRRDRQRALALLLLAVGMHKSIVTVTYNADCPQSKLVGQCNQHPNADSGEKLILKEVTLTECAHGSSNLASGFPIAPSPSPSSLSPSDWYDCQTHGCGANQCLVTTKTCNTTKQTFSCTNKVWTTDQQPFTWFVYLCWEITALVMLFHAPLHCLAPEKEVTTIAGMLLLAYGSYAFQESVELYRSCPGGVGDHDIYITLPPIVKMTLCTNNRYDMSTFGSNLFAGNECARYGCGDQHCLKLTTKPSAKSVGSCVLQTTAANVSNPLLLFWSIAVMLASFGCLSKTMGALYSKCFGCLGHGLAAMSCRLPCCNCCVPGGAKPAAELHDPMLPAQGGAIETEPQMRFDPMTGKPVVA